MRYADITGYAYRYRISEEGCVERYSDSKQVWVAVPVRRRTTKYGGKCRLEVDLVRNRLQCNKHRVAVVTLMADAFMGGRDAHAGLVVAHRNSMTTDCALENLYWTTREELGKRCGGQMRKPVCKLDVLGNLVKVYASVTECCASEFIDRSTLYRMIKNGVSASKSATGFAYQFEK